MKSLAASVRTPRTEGAVRRRTLVGREETVRTLVAELGVEATVEKLRRGGYDATEIRHTIAALRGKP